MTNDASQPPDPTSERRTSDIDLSVAREALGGDEELLKIVTSAFLDECPRLLAELHAGSRTSDANRVRQAAHALKGAIRYFGDTSAYQAAFELEQAASGTKPTDFADLVAKVDSEFQLVQQAIQAATKTDG